jgi:hypothetical protein
LKHNRIPRVQELQQQQQQQQQRNIGVRQQV